MGVDCIWQDERGVPIKVIGDPHMRFSRFVQSGTFGGTCCVRFIDPWGDVTFNQVQIPVLVDELTVSIPSNPDREIQEHVKQIVALARESVGHTHTCLKFIGD